MTHSVFVSSTFVDLVDHRATVQGAIRQLGALDVSMETFGARDERPKDECLRIIATEVDSFVGIYAHRYGFVPKGDTKSITEAEYDAATERNIPRFIYLVNEDALWSPKFIDNGTPGKKLLQFKRRVGTTHVCKRFSTKDDLATSIAADLGRHLLRSALVRVPSSATSTARRTGDPSTWSPADWNAHRYGKYKSSRDIFLVHSIAPSAESGQFFDIFVYLQRHKSHDLDEVQYAEFFLGPYWDDQVFRIENDGHPMGITVSAYGEFLCVCRLVFKNGSNVLLDRYVNFSEYARDDG